jgi:hypothetical protein
LADEVTNTQPEQNPIERFSKLVGEGSLYNHRLFTNFELDIIATALGLAGLRFDLDCPECKKPSTFVLPAVTALQVAQRDKPLDALAALTARPDQ